MVAVALRPSEMRYEKAKATPAAPPAAVSSVTGPVVSILTVQVLGASTLPALSTE